MGKFDDAITQYRKALAIDPNFINSHLGIGAQAYQGKGDAARAKEFSAKAAAFNSLPQLNYAFIRNKAGKQT